MSLLSSLFHRPSPPKIDREKRDLEEFRRSMLIQQGEAQAERDRTARIALYLACVERGDTNCRQDISWEDLAATPMDRGHLLQADYIKGHLDGE